MMKIFDNIKGIKFCALVLLAVMFALSKDCLADDDHWTLFDAAENGSRETYQKNNWDTPVAYSENYQKVLQNLENTHPQDRRIGDFKYEMLTLSNYTTSQGLDKFGSGYANNAYERAQKAAQQIFKSGMISVEDYQILLDEADKIYTEGSNRAKEAAQKAGKHSREERIKNQAEQRPTLTACTDNCAPKCFYKELTTCSFCPLFEVVFNAASTIAKHAIDTFSGSIIRVVVIAFGIWIAFQILAFVSTPEVRDLKDLASSLITQSFIVMLVVIILESGAMNFFNYALTPVYTTGQNLAQTIIKPDTVATSYEGTANASDTQKQLDERANRPCDNKLSGIYDDAKGEGALPKAMGDSIICTMTLIQNRVAQVKALGSASICKSWKEKFFIIPHLNYLLIGVGLWVGAMIMLLAVPFMMIDAVFQLAVAAALLPFAIGSYAFKITRGYSKKVWETFLNSMFQFIFVSLVALMLVVAYQSIIAGSTGDLSYMFAGENDAALSDLLVKLPWFSTAFLKLCFVMILAWSVLSAAKNFAGSFAGSISNTNIGSSIGTMAGSFTKSAATRILEPTAKATAEHLGRGIRAAAVAPIHLARRGAMNYRASRIKRKGTFNAETGQYTLESKHWWGKKKLTLVENADGTKSINKDKERKTLGGGIIVKSKIQTEHFNVRTIRHEKDGQVWYEDKVRLNSSFASHLYRKDGTLNHNDYENLLAVQGTANADHINIALAKEAMAQRMPNAKRDFRNHDYVSQEALYEDGRFVGYVETHRDGSKSVIRLDVSAEDGKGRKRMMTTFTHIDAKGQGVTLKSDGIINSKSTFKTKDGSRDGEIDEESRKTYYRLGAHYDNWFKHSGKNYVRQSMQNSMFSKEEAEQAYRDIYSGRNYAAESRIYEFEVDYS